MALPKTGSSWPPAPYDKLFSDVEEWSVWWEGTSSKLTNFYNARANTYNSMPQGFRTRIKTAVDSFFGSQSGSSSANASELRLHLPIPGALSRKIASLMFSTPPRFVTATGSQEHVSEDEITDVDAMDVQDPVQDRLDELLNTDKTHAFLNEAGQSWASLGGIYLRVVWDEGINDGEPFLDKVDQDHAIPEWQFDQLMSVCFWTELGLDKAGNVLRHFQDYQPGYVEHAFYAGDEREVGVRVNFDAELAEKYMLGKVFEAADDDGIVWLDTEELSAVYIPYDRPNVAWRSKPGLKHMGASLYAKDVIPVFAAIDETWSSLMRDVRQGKGRLIIAENLLELLGPGRGSGFDLSREIFSPVGEGLEQDSKPLIEQVQFDIRVEEHMATIRALFLEVLRRVGISPLTMGLSEQVATTATEIKALTADTLATQSSGQRYWGPALAYITRVMLEIAGETLTEDLEVEWPASVELSDEERAKTVSLWGEAASTKTKIAYLHPDWTPSQVQEEADLIDAEKKAAMPPALEDPFAGGESDDDDAGADGGTGEEGGGNLH